MIHTVSDTSVKKHTGKIWKQWVSLLSEEGAIHWTHQEIVAFLKKKHKLTPWWQQIVSNGYEVATGKRQAGQTLKGTYSLTVTKVVSVENKKVWKWLISKEGLAVWLKPMSPVKIEKGATFEIEGGIFGEIRTIKSPQRVRLFWQEEEQIKPCVVQLFVYARPKNRTMIVIQQDGIQKAQQKAAMRVYWREIIETLAKQFKT